MLVFNILWLVKTVIPQNASSEPFLQSFLKSQMSAEGRHSPDVHVNSPSEQEDTMTNNTVRTPKEQTGHYPSMTYSSLTVCM